MVTVTIDGKEVQVPEGVTILDAALELGIDIPTLCFHEELSRHGGCRMCVVEIEGVRGLQTACTFPVSDGMKVKTQSDEIFAARRTILELLFSERNHYCMYCQVSGDCELQDQAYQHSLEHWTYPRPYEKLAVDASDPYIIMDPNRCILCTRCIRACAEIAANHTLGLSERGARTMVVADTALPLGDSSCVECGTCLQVCPTGSLIDARSAYGGHEEDVTHTQTTCMQCSVGCALDVVTRKGHLIKVEGVWDAGPSEGLLCVDGRFKPLYDERERVTSPMMRNGDGLEPVSWEQALQAIADKMKDGEALGLAACATSNEALQAFADLFDKVDGEAGRMEPLAPELGFGQAGQVQDILDADYIVVAGANPLAYQRVIGYLVKRAVDHKVPLAVIAETENDLSYKAKMTVSYDQAEQVVEDAAGADKVMVVYSVGIQPQAIEALKALGDKVVYLALDPARNGGGAQAAGLAPLATGSADVVYCLLGEQPADEALLDQVRGDFVVVHASHHSGVTERADVVLPAPIWVEREGNFTNIEGHVLPLTAVLPMPEDVRDDAAVLAQLVELV